MNTVTSVMSVVVVISSWALTGTDLQAAEPETKRKQALVEPYLISGKLEEGEKALLAHLQKQPGDDEARFGLGVLQFLQGVENLMQSFHKYGLFHKTDFGAIPFLRLPTPKNPNPEQVDYKKIRKIYETLLHDLNRAQATLAKVNSRDVKLPLHLGLIRLDFNGDGIADEEEEAFWKIFARVTRNNRITPLEAERFAITFDKADVHWLRGYCHLLSALDEFILAHDWQEAFDRTGHLFFAKVDSPFQFLNKKPQRDIWFDPSGTSIADFIALIHLVNFPVKEPQRMKSALAHLEKMIDQSRESWKEIEAETDDENEWIPNPKQKGVIPGVRVTPQMIASWKEFLNEAEDILKGRKLVPHWRVLDGRGINLRRVFTEPKRFDLVLWIQGSSAEPFLEEGVLTEKRFWTRLQQSFNGRFFGFAIWFN